MDVLFVSATVRVRPLFTEAVDRDVYDVGPRGTHGFLSKTQTFDRSGSEVLHEYVCLCSELQHDVLRCLMREVKHHRQFVRSPVRTFSDWGDPVPGFFEVDIVEHCGARRLLKSRSRIGAGTNVLV